MQTTIDATQILVLAAGDSVSAQNAARGRLFEQFVAQLMALFGYEQPTTANLNISSNGIELDVASVHHLTRQRMTAECKAYTTSVEAKEVSSFYGKLQAERFDADTFGYFVSVPGLTKSGRELAGKFESNDKSFRSYESQGILSLLLERKEIDAFEDITAHHGTPTNPLSDRALLVTAQGLFYSAYELAADTRLPIRILVYSARIGGIVPQPVLEHLAKSTQYSRRLECFAGASPAPRLGIAKEREEAIIEVVGSTSDFEYQFPAAPKFFVGRKEIVKGALELLERVEDQTRGRVLVLNAQSGWGKSSLALRILDLARTLGGEGLCIDCRTAASARFVPAAIRHALVRVAAQNRLELPSDASFASVVSVLDTLRRTKFKSRKPVVVFFDQFENVFHDHLLTAAFRDLALGVSELDIPLLIGFAWKTDFVAFTEQYPYQLRDDIRSKASVIALPPLGPTDTSQLLRRLQDSCGQRLHAYLRERLRVYSQGLPWLLKKLGSHIISEIAKGTTQDQLLTEALNVQVLFESDMSGLSLVEREALKAIAKRVPLSVAEAFETAAGKTDIVQSLVNQRLLVSIGEKLDVYWDVFRDYLNQGTVPLQDGYILRLTPSSARKLLAVITKLGGSTTAEAVAAALNTSQISVLNMARDLRQLGVLAAQEGVLRLADDIAGAKDINGSIQTRVSASLRRHRVFSFLGALCPSGTRITLGQFAEALPKVYPAVAAKAQTWLNYARAFAFWFRFAGLISITRDEITFGSGEVSNVDMTSPSSKRRLTTGITVFPRSQPGALVRFLKNLDLRVQVTRTSTIRRTLSDAILIGFVHEDANSPPRLTDAGRAFLRAEGQERIQALFDAIGPQPSVAIAREMLVANPGASPISIGRAVAASVNTDWSDSTSTWVGKALRSWMREIGVWTSLRSNARLLPGLRHND